MWQCEVSDQIKDKKMIPLQNNRNIFFNGRNSGRNYLRDLINKMDTNNTTCEINELNYEYE